jgi:diacylglycerol kinase family enzyme
MKTAENRKFLFVLNAISGAKSVDWQSVIEDFFKGSPHIVDFYVLPEKINTHDIRAAIRRYNADHVVAVGGDGTVTLLAECLIDTEMSLGILPAGSANGMAKELGIATDARKALEIIAAGHTRKISAVRINDRLSIHLADVGLNAYMIKEFHTRGKRGLFGYIMATAKVLWKKRHIRADLQFNGWNIGIKADLIIIANATSFGTGVVVNPVGKLDDNVFEVIAVQDVSAGNLIKTSLQKSTLDRTKAKIFQMSEGKLVCKKPVHFQVDGEYLGKVTEIDAKLLRDCLRIIVPAEPA